MIRLVQIRQDGLDACEEFLAGVGQNDRARCSGKQSDAKAPFKRSDRSRCHGLGLPEVTSRARETASLRRSYEKSQCVNSVAHRPD